MLRVKGAFISANSEVKMGELKVGRNPTLFNCSGLGSCVALFLYDATEKVGGVAHIMLPESNQDSKGANEYEGKFADRVPKMLLRKLKNIGGKRERIEAKLVGGADMFPLYKSEELSKLGERIIRILKEELKEMNIRVVAEDTCGHHGRTATFNLEDMKVHIKTAFGEDNEI